MLHYEQAETMRKKVRGSLNEKAFLDHFWRVIDFLFSGM